MYDRLGYKWTGDEDDLLRALSSSHHTALIALKIGRTEAAIRSRAAKLRVSLAPSEQRIG